MGGSVRERDEVVLLSAGITTELCEKVVAWTEHCVGLVLLCMQRLKKDKMPDSPQY